MTIRLAEDQADEIEVIARVDGVPVSEAIRQAVAALKELRRADPDFQRRLRERIAIDKLLLQRLAVDAGRVPETGDGHG